MFSFAKKLVDRLEGSAVSSDQTPSDSYFKTALQLNNRGYALRVLNVVPHSVGHTKGFESWFDYIVRINGHELPMMNPSLSSYAYNIGEDGYINYGGNVTAEQAGLINIDLLNQEINGLAKNESVLTFDVWSAKGGVLRQISVPLTKFEKTDSSIDQSVQKLFENTFAQIGLTLQSHHLNTATYVWRILKTHQGSPAFVSQLVPYSDYIIGCDSAYPDDTEGRGLLATGGESLLSRVLLSYYNHHYAITQTDDIPVTLYVYNHDYDVLRPVTVNLSKSWGTGHNRGLLGCDVGYGLLHRIPEVVGKFDNNSFVEDVLFENNQSYGFDATPPPGPAIQPIQPSIPPVNSAAAAQAPFVPVVGPPPRTAAKKKKHTAGSSVALDGLSDYMNEELAKSKQLDNSSKVASTDSLPPPPPTKAS